MKNLNKPSLHKCTIIYLCLLLALFWCLSGCSDNMDNKNNVEHFKNNIINVESFSYTEDFEYHKDDAGTKTTGFINTQKTQLEGVLQAVELAKKECTVEYDTISAAFDADLKIYRISFFMDEFLGGDQNVYINQDGITQMIVYGE